MHFLKNLAFYWGAVSGICSLLFILAKLPIIVRTLLEEFAPDWLARQKKRQAERYKAKVARQFDRPSGRMYCYPFYDCLLNRYLLIIATILGLLACLIITAP